MAEERRAGGGGDDVGAAPEPVAGRRRHEEEMPRVPVTRRQAVAFGCSSSRWSASCTSCCPSSPGWARRVHHIEHGDNWWIAIGVVLELLSFAGYVLLFRAVFVATAHRSRDRLAGELPDHDGRPGRHAPVRDRRRRWDRADRLGAAPLGDGAATGGVPDGRVHGAAVCGLCGLAADRRLGLGTGLFPGGGSFAITIVPGDRGGGADRGGRRDGAAAGRHRAAPAAVGLGLRAARALGGAGGDRAGAGGERGAHRDRADPRARSRPAGSGRLVGL